MGSRLPALAVASTPADPSSCMGQEAAALSLRGSSEEFSGGMAELNAYFFDLGVTPGSAYHLFASLHEGSHEACDEAFE